MGISIINQPFWGYPHLWNPPYEYLGTGVGSIAVAIRLEVQEKCLEAGSIRFSLRAEHLEWPKRSFTCMPPQRDSHTRPWKLMFGISMDIPKSMRWIVIFLVEFLILRYIGGIPHFQTHSYLQPDLKFALSHLGILFCQATGLEKKNQANVLTFEAATLGTFAEFHCYQKWKKHDRRIGNSPFLAPSVQNSCLFVF